MTDEQRVKFYKVIRALKLGAAYSGSVTLLLEEKGWG
jgi:hypothetical protein